MRAQFVNENISFERGRDPKAVMGLGNEEDRIIGKLEELQKLIGGRIVIEKGDSYGPDKTTYTLLSTYKLGRGGKIRITFIPDISNYNVRRYYLACDYSFSRGANARLEGDIQKNVFDYIDKWLEKWNMNILDETVNFERGKDPKESMGIGINKQFQEALERLLLRDADNDHKFVINSIAFPMWSKTIDFVVDDWSDDTLDDTKDYIMGLASEDEWFDIFDFIDGDKFVGGGQKNGVFKFVAVIDSSVVKGLKGKMIYCSNDGKTIEIKKL